MSRLIQGQESEKKIDLLLTLTRINSTDKINALKLHLVRGYPASMAYGLCDVKQQNFRLSLEALNQVYAVHEQLKELED